MTVNMVSGHGENNLMLPKYHIVYNKKWSKINIYI